MEADASGDDEFVILESLRVRGEVSDPLARQLMKKAHPHPGNQHVAFRYL